MTRQQLERHQVWIYLAAIFGGLASGTAAPASAPAFETILWPALGLLLYVTFTQVPLTHLPAAFRDARFMSAVLAGNFILVPLLVWVLLHFLPDEPGVRLGVLLVLLVPCTDWFITFTHLGGGDARRAIAVTPVNLLAQLALLPFYLWLFLGENFAQILAAGRVAVVFFTLVILPLAGAYLTERWAERGRARAAVLARLGALPVPLLALVVFLIAASQVQAVSGAAAVLAHTLPVFLGFLAGAAVLGWTLARGLRLAPASARALVFSLGTRNSFVVLPFALALPPSWEIAVVVIVLQSLVELFGMMAYLYVVPQLFVRDSRSAQHG